MRRRGPVAASDSHGSSTSSDIEHGAGVGESSTSHSRPHRPQHRRLVRVCATAVSVLALCCVATVWALGLFVYDLWTYPIITRWRTGCFLNRGCELPTYTPPPSMSTLPPSVVTCGFGSQPQLRHRVCDVQHLAWRADTGFILHRPSFRAADPSSPRPATPFSFQTFGATRRTSKWRMGLDFARFRALPTVTAVNDVVCDSVVDVPALYFHCTPFPADSFHAQLDGVAALYVSLIRHFGFQHEPLTGTWDPELDILPLPGCEPFIPWKSYRTPVPNLDMLTRSPPRTMADALPHSRHTYCFRRAMFNAAFIASLDMDPANHVYRPHLWPTWAAALRERHMAPPVASAGAVASAAAAATAAVTAPTATTPTATAPTATAGTASAAPEPPANRPRVVFTDRASWGSSPQVALSVNRRWINLPSLLALCRPLGLDCAVVDRSMTESVAAVAGVLGNGISVLVGIHGAQLLNSIFLPPDAAGVIEVKTQRSSCDGAPDHPSVPSLTACDFSQPQECGLFTWTFSGVVSAVLDGGRLHYVETAGGPPAAPIVDAQALFKVVCDLVPCQQEVDTLPAPVATRPLRPGVKAWCTAELTHWLESRVPADAARLSLQDTVTQHRLCGASLPHLTVDMLVAAWGVHRPVAAHLMCALEPLFSSRSSPDTDADPLFAGGVDTTVACGVFSLAQDVPVPSRGWPPRRQRLHPDFQRQQYNHSAVITTTCPCLGQYDFSKLP